MSITLTAARTGVRAATTAGKKVTVTTNDGVSIAGTARWAVPGDTSSGTATRLMLFGANELRGPWTGTATNATSTTSEPNNPYMMAFELPAYALETRWVGTSQDPATWPASTPYNVSTAAGTLPMRTTTMILSLNQLASIAQTASTGDADLLPGQSNNADTTLGTRVNEFGTTVADSAWSFGTGLE